VGPSVRLARGGGLHRPKGEWETGSGAGIGPGRIKVRRWVLHRGEGETAAEENGGNVDVSRHHVPLRYRLQTRL